MNEKTYLDPNKLNKLQHLVWENAKAHGWHEKPLSPEHYCGLIMTEMAEAVEADRNGRRAKTDMMADVMKTQAEGEIGLTQQWYETWFQTYYKEYIKGSIEEEFADVVIRLLDMAQAIHGEAMFWIAYYPSGETFNKDKSFIENAWNFIRRVLNYGTMNISDSVAHMYDWSEHLGIDLDQHIEWKMKYNELRPYKHGGKKY